MNSTKDKLENETPHFGNTLLGAVPSVVYNEDCVDGLKRFPENYFDLAIVDPPYGIGRSGQTETFTKNPKHKRKHFADKGWDTETPASDYWNNLS